MFGDVLDEAAEVVSEVADGAGDEGRGAGRPLDAEVGEQVAEDSKGVSLSDLYAFPAVNLDARSLAAEGEEGIAGEERRPSEPWLLGGALEEDGAGATPEGGEGGEGGGGGGDLADCRGIGWHGG